MTVTVKEILDKAKGGWRLGRGEALALYREAPLDELGEAAHERRRFRTDPRRVTYLVDRNVNYTNVCVTD